eukprot:TRINITY_DN21534_c0_g1_i1.p1 TRINITY_DN21534_c0_g1~~TRINITY_DN21534_c0_g1_i1.p1  ORF type:complete len:478 (+),score=156.77 TRINITY_DN21534_c0_g1_i1:90-1436(+)
MLRTPAVRGVSLFLQGAAKGNLPVKQPRFVTVPPTSQRTGVPADADELSQSAPSVAAIRSVLMSRLRRGRLRRKKILSKKREHVVMDAPDLWPVHSRGVAYCPNPAEADSLIGSVVFDADELPEVVSIRVERRLSEYNPPSRFKSAGAPRPGGLSSSRVQYIPNPIAVMTVSTEKHVVVMHIVQWGDYNEWANDVEMPYFTRLLRSNRVAKICSNASQVTVALKHELNLDTSGFIDLSLFARETLGVAQRNGIYFQPAGFSFHSLANHFYNGRFPRPVRLLMSNWHVLPLSHDQLVFTSNEAYTTLQMYKRLISIAERAEVSPHGPYHHVHVVINSLVMRFAEDPEVRRKDFKKDSNFYGAVEGLLSRAFRDFGGVDWFWFTGDKQSVAVGFRDESKLGQAITAFAGHKNIIVTDRPVKWSDAKEEFRLRYGARRATPQEPPEQFEEV